MLIFFLLSQPRFWISSQIMQPLREMLHGSVTFARAGVRSSSATKVLEVTKPVLLLFTSLALVAGVTLQTGTKLIPSNTAWSTVCFCHLCLLFLKSQLQGENSPGQDIRWAQLDTDTPGFNSQIWVLLDSKTSGKNLQKQSETSSPDRFGCFHLLLSTLKEIGGFAFSFTIPCLFLLTLHNSYSVVQWARMKVQPEWVDSFLAQLPHYRLTGMLCKGYLPPGKHSRTPTSRHHESGHNSFLLERFNSMLLHRFYILFFLIAVKQDMSQCPQVLTTCLRFCKN